jgi:hypothetical protein
MVSYQLGATNLSLKRPISSSDIATSQLLSSILSLIFDRLDDGILPKSEGLTDRSVGVFGSSCLHVHVYDFLQVDFYQE